MEKLWVYLTIGLGSALGGMGRFWMAGVVADRVGRVFPWGTLAVNVTGSFVIGLLAALVAPGGLLSGQARVREFFMIGLCGGYTTFSSFSLETLNLARDGQWLPASLNALLSVVSCLVAVWIGHWLGQSWNR